MISLPFLLTSKVPDRLFFFSTGFFREQNGMPEKPFALSIYFSPDICLTEY